MRLLPALRASPDAAVLLALAGLMLIYWELNRPGLVLPGAAGLFAVLFAVAALAAWPLNAPALVLLLASLGTQVLALRSTLPRFIGPVVGIGAGIASYHLIAVNYGGNVHAPAAVLAGFLLGPGTSMLTAIAKRARSNKGLDS